MKEFSSLREQVFLRIPDPNPWPLKIGSRIQQRLATRVSRLFPTPVRHPDPSLPHSAACNGQPLRTP
ncbi:MAG: hypothetical protein WAN16_06275 [Chthoniobacterales bacterium]